MDAALYSKEQTALKSIANYMSARFNARVEYKYKKLPEPHIPIEIQIFWDECICAFRGEVMGLFCRPDIKLSKNSEVLEEPESGKAISKDNSLPEEFLREDDDSGWVTPLVAFKYAYDELIYSYGIEDVKLLRKLDKLFTQFIKKVNDYIERDKKKSNLQGSIFGTDNFVHLPYLLDIQKEEIRELLPYFLTAYTLKSWNSRFLYKEQRLAQLICPTIGKEADSIDPTEASKVRHRIQSFSHIFSLEGCTKKKLIIASKSRPAPYLALFDMMNPKEVKNPYIRYKEVLNQVFDIWCKIVVEYAPWAEIEDFPSNVDLICCQKLYFGYTNSD